MKPPVFSDSGSNVGSKNGNLWSPEEIVGRYHLGCLDVFLESVCARHFDFKGSLRVANVYFVMLKKADESEDIGSMILIYFWSTLYRPVYMIFLPFFGQ